MTLDFGDSPGDVWSDLAKQAIDAAEAELELLKTFCDALDVTPEEAFLDVFEASWVDLEEVEGV